MERSDTDVTEYLASLPDDIRGPMQELDSVISAGMKGLDRVLFTGTFWGGSDQEIIGYGTYSSPRSDGTNVEWFVIGLARQKTYYSLYVSAVDGDTYLSKTMGPTLGKVKIGASSISFTSVDAIDLDALRDLVARARELSADLL